MTKPIILITGSAGFIGSTLVGHALSRGYEVIGIDDMGPGSNPENIIKHKHYKFIEGTICNTASFEGFITDEEICRIEHLVHLAAESHVDRSLQNDGPFWQTQVFGTHMLMTWATGLPSLQTFINQITDEVYGERTPASPAAPGASFNPRPPYACSKAAQYFVGRSFYNLHDLPVMSTFPVNNFGVNQAPEKLIPRTVKLLCEGYRAAMMESFHYKRDWLHVDDMCEALLLLCEEGTAGEDYNIGVFNHLTLIDIVRLCIHAVYGLDLRGDMNAFEDYIEVIPDRKTHDMCYAVVDHKMQKLGWVPTKSNPQNIIEVAKQLKVRFT